MLAEFKLEKIRIFAYRSPLRGIIPSNIAKNNIPFAWLFLKSMATFEAMYNPESLKISYRTEWQEDQGLGRSGSPVRYVNTKPEKINFQLIFSSVGVERAGLAVWEKIESVSERVKAFSNITGYQDKIHRPYYLSLAWGETLRSGKYDYYPCQLSSVDVSYTQFDRKGKPIRAELDVEFTEDHIPEPKGQGKSSPDVTHARVVKAGDTLPMMAEKVYENPSYYMRTAEANRLDSVRDIQSGDSLVFPPIEK